MKKQVKALLKILLMRFIRGFLASSISAMSVIATNYKIEYGSLNLFPFFQVLAVAGILGGITGGLLAADKWSRTNLKELK